MKPKKLTSPEAPRSRGLRAVCSVLPLTACLTVGSAQGADQGPRHHAQGEYDSATATYMVIADDDLIAISERFEIPVETLAA